MAKEDFRYIPKTAGTQKNPDSSKTDFKVTKPKGTCHWNVSYFMTLKGKKIHIVVVGALKFCFHFIFIKAKYTFYFL